MLVKFGDLRKRWIKKERPGDGKFPKVIHNSWVEIENAIPTEERESETGTYFFFEPMLGMNQFCRSCLEPSHRTV